MNEAQAVEMPRGWAAAKIIDVVSPRTGKADPRAPPHAKFIGMETVKRFYQHYGQMKSVKGDDVRAAKQRRMLELAQAMS